MAASQWRVRLSTVPSGVEQRYALRGATRSSQLLSSSSSRQQQQGGWLQRAAAAAALIRPSLPHQQQDPACSDLQDEQKQWLPYNPAAAEQQELHDWVVWEQQQAAQQQHQLQPSSGWPQDQSHLHRQQQQHQTQPRTDLWLQGQQPRAPGSSSRHQQQQQQHHRPSRTSGTNRSWQWLASQLELDSGSLTWTGLVDYLVQLAQPGVSPAGADRANSRFSSFLVRLLMLLHQHLQAALLHQQPHQQQHVQDLSISLSQVAKVLWALAKLQLVPNWDQLQQHQHQHQHGRNKVLFSQHQLQQSQVQQRAAAVITSAAQLLQLHLGRMQTPIHQQQQGSQQHRLLPQAIWSLAKLRYPADAALLQLYMDATQPLLLHYSCKDLSNIAWGLGQLQWQPSPQWQAAFFDAAAAAVASSAGEHGGAQAAAALLLHVAEFEMELPQGWLQYVLPCILGNSSQVQHLQQYSHPPSVEATSRHHHPHPQQQQQQQLAGPLLQQMPGRSLASLFGALAKLDHVPDAACFCQLQRAVEQQLHSCNGLDAAQLLWALATIAAAAPAVACDDSHPANNANSSSGSSRQHRWDTTTAGAATGDAQQQLSLLQAYSGKSSGTDGGSAAVLLLSPDLLQGLTARLADTVRHTPPAQVVLGLWATAKLHAMTRPAPQQQQQQPLPTPSQHQQQQQQRQERQHWRVCREVILYCLSHFQSGGVLGQLNAHSLSLLAWGLVLAGAAAPPDFNATQQQQQQQPLGATTSSSSSSNDGSSSNSSNGRFVGLILPAEFLRQLLACSRLCLSAAAPHSQALLLSALMHLQVVPSWQWLLGFWEASQPQLARCSAQDLSMLAEGLVRLRAKPLSSWLAAFLEAIQGLLLRAQACAPVQGLQVLQAKQGSAGSLTGAAAAAATFPAGALTNILGAVSDPTWGLVLQDQQGSSSSCSSSLVPHSWVAAVQQHLLLLLPELQPGQVALLLRAAVRLGWCTGDDSSTPTSSSSSSSRRIRSGSSRGSGIEAGTPSHVCGAAVVSSLLQVAVGASGSSGSSEQQQQVGAGTTAAATAGEAVGLLQCMSAALQLPAGTVPQQWWSAAAVKLLQCLRGLQQQGQQQQLLLALTHRQLHAGLHTLNLVLTATNGSRCNSSSALAAAGEVQLSVLQSMQLVSTAAANRAAGMQVQELLLFLLLSRDCLQTLGTTAQHQPCDDTLLLLSKTQDRSGSSSSSSGCLLATQVAVQELQQAVCAALVDSALPRASLQDFAACVYTLSRCDLMSTCPAASAAAAAGVGDGDGVATPGAHVADDSSSSSGGSSRSGPEVVAAVLAVLQQQLLHLERVMLQEQLYLTQLQQQQQSAAAAGSGSSGNADFVLSTISCSVVAQEEAPHMVRLLAAFARCSYRPPAHILRQMLRVIEAGMATLTPRQLSVLAAAASTLQLGFLAGPGFCQQLWQALRGVLQPPEQLQLELNQLYLQQQQQQGLGMLGVGFSTQQAADHSGAAAGTPTTAGAATAQPAVPQQPTGVVQQASRSCGLALLSKPYVAIRPARTPTSSSSSSSSATSSSSGSSGQGGSSGKGGSTASGGGGSGGGGCDGLSRSGFARPSSSSVLSSSMGLQYSVDVLMAIKGMSTLSSGHSTSTTSDRPRPSRNSSSNTARSRSRSNVHGQSLHGISYAAACSRSCRSALGKQLPRALAAAAYKAAATAVQHTLLPTSQLQQAAMRPLEQQQQQRKQQHVAVIVPLLRLLKPLACLITSADLKNFTLRVGPLLRVLEGREKVRAWKALHAVLDAYQSGQQLRQHLLQRQRERALLLLKRRRPHQGLQQQRQQRRQRQHHGKVQLQQQGLSGGAVLQGGLGAHVEATAAATAAGVAASGTSLQQALQKQQEVQQEVEVCRAAAADVAAVVQSAHAAQLAAGTVAAPLQAAAVAIVGAGMCSSASTPGTLATHSAASSFAAELPSSSCAVETLGAAVVLKGVQLEPRQDEGVNGLTVSVHPLHLYHQHSVTGSLRQAAIRSQQPGDQAVQQENQQQQQQQWELYEQQLPRMSGHQLVQAVVPC